MLTKIHARYAINITNLKKNPQAVIDSAQGETIALLNRNKLAAYIVPADLYEKLMDQAEDMELARIIEERKLEKDQAITVHLDEL